MWIIAALAFLPTQALALKVECKNFAAWHNSSLKLEEHQNYYSVTTDGKTETFQKVITKSFGTLLDAGLNMENRADQHIFAHDSIGGVPVIIVDSMIFMPTCAEWNIAAPKPVVAPEGLWLLKPKL